MPVETLVATVIAIFGVVTTIVGATWNLRAALTKGQTDATDQLATVRSAMSEQLANVHNAMVARLQMAEDGLEEKITRSISGVNNRISEMDRDVAEFKVYCERNFATKEAIVHFTTQQSVERAALRTDIVERLVDMKEQIKDIRNAQGV